MRLLPLLLLAFACRQPVDETAEPEVDADADGVPAGEDCDDDDPAVHPGADETCDGIDEDCDGAVDDEATNATTWYADADGDGHGGTDGTTACDAPADHLPTSTDCDDADAAVHPGATETCDGVDEDCDGAFDEDAGDQATFYADADGDGFGAGAAVTACAQPEGHVADATDCDDARADAHPGADETCDAADEDCDGEVDEGVTITLHADGDGDGYGAGETTEACAASDGWVEDDTDCDDAQGAVHPGADESCNDGDDDCDGLTDEGVTSSFYADGDGDGYGAGGAVEACAPADGQVADATDCDDAQGAVHPGADEICNEVDDDCDGATDEGLKSTFHADADGDGYGGGTTSEACAASEGWVADGTDCDDASAAIHPGADEVCDGEDNTCGGGVDPGVCVDMGDLEDLLDAGEAALVVSGVATIDTGTGEITGVRGAGTGLVDGIWFEVVPRSGGPDRGVFSADGVDISGALTAVGPNALVIVSNGDVSVAGSLVASGAAAPDALRTAGPNAGGAPGPGGWAGGKGSDNHYAGQTPGDGPGAGGIGRTSYGYGIGGGGGGHCWGGGGGYGNWPEAPGKDGTATGGGAGGAGGDGVGGAGGEPVEATVLRGGSGGGGGISDNDYNPNGAGAGGGGGGGAVRIAAQGEVEVSGLIDVSGGRGGSGWDGGGGGGSGGMLVLDGVTVDVSGVLTADGGRGGHGNLLWSPSSTGGGRAGAGTTPGGGGGSVIDTANHRGGGGGGAAGRILVRTLDGATLEGAISPAMGGDCAADESM